MTVDREQTRRDAERYLDDVLPTPERHLANHVLALLAELEQAERDALAARTEASEHYSGEIRRLKLEWEQAERERDEARECARKWEVSATLAEAQLAKVPALVEKGDAMAERLAQTTALYSLVEEWVKAREAYEQEQKP